jgi:CheY-like chemotaxis protein
MQQLNALGYTAESVCNGVEAVQRLLQQTFDLILMDIGLPEMDGLTAAKQIRKVETIAKQRRIPIVATTSRSNRNECLEAGIDDYLEKPVVLDKLRATLDRWLKRGNYDGKLVLIVEDDETNRRVLSVLLERMGIAHDFANDGMEAVARTRKTDYALILMDIKMPTLDGYKATQTIRNCTRNGKDVPIVAVTAQAMDGDLEKCIWAGMNDYLPKPYTREDLESVVSRWLK